MKVSKHRIKEILDGLEEPFAGASQDQTFVKKIQNELDKTERNNYPNESEYEIIKAMIFKLDTGGSELIF